MLSLGQRQSPLRPVIRFEFTAHSRCVCTTPLSTPPSDPISVPSVEHSLSSQVLEKASLNPWNFLLVSLEHPLLRSTNLSMDQLYDLLQHIRGQRGKEFRTGIRDTWTWCNRNSRPDQYQKFPSVTLKTLQQSLSPEYRILEQLVQAHVNMAHVKYRYSRGRYAGSQNISGGWNINNDRNRLFRALAFNAFFGKRGGVLLNLLLDSGLGRSEFHRALPAKLRGPNSFISADQLRNMTVDAKSIFDRVGDPDLFEILWQANNIDMGVALISEMVIGHSVGENKNFDSALTALALNLMHAARMCNDHARCWETFRMCHMWLRQSTSAYNILMYADAKACNLGSVVMLLKNMQMAGALPNAVTWTTILSGMCMSNRLEGAKKLFALHLHSLQYSDGALDGGMEPNLWQQWYEKEDRASRLDPFISTWIREIASQYHGTNEPLQKGKKADGEPRRVIPWMPTLATHRVIIKTLVRELKTDQAVQYFELLRKVWPVYGRWAMVKRHVAQFVDPSDWPTDHGRKADDPINGLRSLERILYGHLAEHRSDVRELYGLGPVVSTDDKPISVCYPRHCQSILEMISNIGNGKKLKSPHVEKLVYAKSLHAHALIGDLPTILHHMQRYPQLNDIGVWTSVVRCICVQVLDQPSDDLLHPSFDITGYEHLLPPVLLANSNTSWLTFALTMCSLLSNKGVHFTQVTFGTLVQTAAKLGDLQSILLIVEFMQRFTNVRFNVEMLRMVVVQEFSFERKCSIIKEFLDALDGSGGLLGGRSTVNVDSKLLTFVVRLVARPEDFVFLRDIVDVFATQCGLLLKDIDYRFIILKCRELDMHEEAEYWTHKLTSQL
ncbi:hypothetical protein GGF39_003824 [Coemansia sp. RSA 1721]|nr:hypothetical protein GGF39_003824 [Coemansia sp. RSA 1721]